MDHQAIDELHGLGALTTELTRNDNLATLGATLHNVANDAVAGASGGQSGEQLEAERFALGDGRKTTIFHALGIQLDAALGEAEALLDDGREFADAATILSKNGLSTAGTDDDLSALGGVANFDAGVAILRQESGQEFVKLGIENTIGNKLKKRKVRNLYKEGRAKEERILFLSVLTGEFLYSVPCEGHLNQEVSELLIQMIIIQKLDSLPRPAHLTYLALLAHLLWSHVLDG